MSKSVSHLLINEAALQALPSLACLVGLTGAVILQQIHWWSGISEHRMEGYIWVYNSYRDWTKQFRWLTARALQKQILQLEKSGYLISKCFAYHGKGRTKWYRVDYEHLNNQCEKSNNDSENIHIEGENSNIDGEKSNNNSALSSHHSYLTHASKNTSRIHKDNQRVPVELEALQNLPYWIKEYHADIEWLSEFKEEFPVFSEKHIKACRDYWDGKRVKHKGQWKSRLRNWLKHEKEFAGSRQSNLLPTETDLVAAAEKKGLNK